MTPEQIKTRSILDKMSLCNDAWNSFFEEDYNGKDQRLKEILFYAAEELDRQLREMDPLDF